MARYLIKLDHPDMDCETFRKALIAEGPQSDFEMGCEGGEHCAYAIIEVEDKDQALLTVPSNLRNQAQIVKLVRYDPSMAARTHGH